MPIPNVAIDGVSTGPENLRTRIRCAEHDHRAVRSVGHLPATSECQAEQDFDMQRWTTKHDQTDAPGYRASSSTAISFGS